MLTTKSRSSCDHRRCARPAGDVEVLDDGEDHDHVWLRYWVDALHDDMRVGTAHQKGLRLEELVCRLFAQVPGFRPGGRVLTQTEEIDLRIGNASDDPIWRRESALLLGECKNWTSSCGAPRVLDTQGQAPGTGRPGQLRLLGLVERFHGKRSRNRCFAEAKAIYW